MSVPQPTLFGAYPWAVGSGIAPLLFGEGFLPQTYSLALSESMTPTEAEIFTATKALTDSVTISVADAKVLSHALSDSSTASDAVATTLQRIFAETGSLTDTNVVFTIKTLSDFLILKEWISVRLTKPLVWTNPGTNAAVHNTLWGRYLFGTQLFGGVKAAASWTSLGRRSPSVWTNTDGSKYNY